MLSNVTEDVQVDLAVEVETEGCDTFQDLDTSFGTTNDVSLVESGNQMEIPEQHEVI